MVAEDIIISCFLVSCFVLFCQALHKQGLANTDHTTLLLNCYTKLKDVSMLDEFIMVCAYRFISCEQALFLGGGRWYKECPLPPPHSPSPILFLHSRVTCSHTGQIIQRKKEHFTVIWLSSCDHWAFILTARFVYWRFRLFKSFVHMENLACGQKRNGTRVSYGLKSDRL